MVYETIIVRDRNLHSVALKKKLLFTLVVSEINFVQYCFSCATNPFDFLNEYQYYVFILLIKNSVTHIVDTITQFCNTSPP